MEIWLGKGVQSLHVFLVCNYSEFEFYCELWRRGPQVEIILGNGVHRISGTLQDVRVTQGVLEPLR